MGNLRSRESKRHGGYKGTISKNLPIRYQAVGGKGDALVEQLKTAVLVERDRKRADPEYMVEMIRGYFNKGVRKGWKPTSVLRDILRIWRPINREVVELEVHKLIDENVHLFPRK